MNRFDIPKLYLADFTYGDSPLNRKRLPYAIIDGKQRLEAIMDFFEGRITLNDDFVLLENPSMSLGGMGFKDLQTNFSDIADAFEEYELLVMSVMAINEEYINELFVRLNRSKPLTGAEVRNAMKGPAPEIIRQIAKNEFFTTNIHFAVDRGEDLNVAAKVLSFEYHSGLRATKKSDLDEFVGEAAKMAEEKLELAGREVLDVLSPMTEIFLPKDRLLTSSGLIPVFYWLVRSRPESDYPRIREFLLRFEADRTRNRELVRQRLDSSDIDQELHEYDQYNRSTNDLRSHIGRFKILSARFDRHTKKRVSGRVP